jgi:hypothetical protein
MSLSLIALKTLVGGLGVVGFSLIGKPVTQSDSPGCSQQPHP